MSDVEAAVAKLETLPTAFAADMDPYVFASVLLEAKDALTDLSAALRGDSDTRAIEVRLKAEVGVLRLQDAMHKLQDAVEDRRRPGGARHAASGALGFAIGVAQMYRIPAQR